MAHPTFWPTKTFFYPIGNTSPVSLLQHVPPSNDAAILILGCGDPRNILYTIYSSGRDLAKERKLQFLCCDHEPAILARNLLLLTLIADGAHAHDGSSLWNIFYHFFLDDTSLALLLQQSQKLVEASVDLDTWTSCQYSKCFHIGNRFTLAELHRKWTSYVQTGSFTADRKKKFTEDFIAGVQAVYNDQFADFDKSLFDGTVARSAGPLYFSAAEVCGQSSHDFWKTGTTSPSPGGLPPAIHANPTFAYASDGEGFRAHYGSNPITAFHLAPIFANATRPPSLSDVYVGTRAQFQMWCEAFYVCNRNPSGLNITIRVLVGDVLATCEALQTYGMEGAPDILPRAGTLSANLALLDGFGSKDGATPSTFDVIDTSNLCDHIGTLNILIATRPLLRRTPCATLYTETLLPDVKDPIGAISERLCSDLTTMSLLLDLTPVSYLSGYTTDSNTHEILSFRMHDNAGQYHERLAWKAPSLLATGGAQAPNFDSKDLASILYAIYRRMFAHEDISEMFRKLSSTIQKRNKVAQYSRKSFAALVRCVRGRVATNWTEVFDALIPCIMMDTTLLPGNLFYQDLLTQLHLFGLHSDPNYCVGDPLLLQNKAYSRFRSWTTVPPVVCVAFSVDRAQLRAIEEDGAPVHPHLTVQLSGRGWENDFACVEMMFGRLRVERRGEHAIATVEQCPRGRHGSAPLVVAACVPAWIIGHEPRSAVVRLGLMSTPCTVHLIHRLGPRLTLFEVPLMDETYLHVLRGRPTLVADGRAAIPYLPLPPVPASVESSPATVAVESSKATLFTKRVEMTNPQAKKALAMAETPVFVSQMGPCAVKLSVGAKCHFDLDFPFSADATRVKLRVARKSSWVEVVLPIVPLGSSCIPFEHRFPLTQVQKSLSPWAIHRLNLDRLPVLKLGDVGRLKWVNTIATIAMSDRERNAREREGKKNGAMDALSWMKASLHSIFVCAAGIQGPTAPRPSRSFGLNRTPKGGMDTLLFIADLRLDVASHSIVADAFVLPLTKALVRTLGQALAGITGELIQIRVSDAECTAWKALLPALAERCRSEVHRADCAYAVQGRVPLTLEHSQVPICECGKGQVTEAFRRRHEWAPFAPYVTRVALSPLFAVSYLEPVAGQVKELLREREGVPTGAAVPAGERAQDCCARCRAALPAGKRMVCSRCKKVAYCGAVCQKEDWKTHKTSCRRA